MTGFEVAEELSVIAPRVPVILYTANDDMCTADRAMRLTPPPLRIVVYRFGVRFVDQRLVRTGST